MFKQQFIESFVKESGKIMFKQQFIESFVKGSGKTTASFVVMGVFTGMWYMTSYALQKYFLRKKISISHHHNNKNTQTFDDDEDDDLQEEYFYRQDTRFKKLMDTL